jgi:hypothetical protein
MIDLNQFKAFRREASDVGYESEQPKNEVKESDGSTTIWYESGDWRFHDNFFGGEPYGGRTIISYKNKPVWIMVYYGWLDAVSNVNEAYLFLRKALRAEREDGFRGPRKFAEGKFKYINNWQGTLENYSGKEEIYLDGDLIYTATYMGGLVDQREGN